jgi:hypothetical protein
MLPRRVGGSMVTFVRPVAAGADGRRLAEPAAPGTAVRPHARHGRGREAPASAAEPRLDLFLEVISSMPHGDASRRTGHRA